MDQQKNHAKMSQIKSAHIFQQQACIHLQIFLCHAGFQCSIAVLISSVTIAPA